MGTYTNKSLLEKNSYYDKEVLKELCFYCDKPLNKKGLDIGGFVHWNMDLKLHHKCASQLGTALIQDAFYLALELGKNINYHKYGNRRETASYKKIPLWVIEGKQGI
jgi:hypothetical protein